MTPPKPMFFATAEDFGVWLRENSASAPELLVGFWKVGSGRASMNWPDSVDEALCVGWIDGVRKRIDEHAYQIRFTPRRSGSIWSAVNIAKVQALIESGRMLPAGLLAFETRQVHKSVVHSREQAPASEFSAAELRQFKQAKVAWAFFESCPPSYRKSRMHWVTSAKQAATRQRRLDKLIEVCGQQLRY